jgi:hypothetical protein
VQWATVTLQNNENDDTEHQQQRIRFHHDQPTEEISSCTTSEDHHRAAGRVEELRSPRLMQTTRRRLWYEENLIGTNRLSTVICCYKLSAARFAIQSDPSGLCSASWASYNKRTMEEGLWGMWAFRPDAK